MQDTSVSNKSLSTRQTLGIMLWIIKIHIDFAKLDTILFIISRIILELDGLMNAYIYAAVIDTFIKAAQQQNVTLNDFIPTLLIIFLYNIFISAFGYVNSYARSQVRMHSRNKMRQLTYKKLNELGLQTLENPEVVNIIQRAKEALDTSPDYIEKLVTFIARIIKLIISAIIIFTILPIVIPIFILLSIPRLITNKHYAKLDYSFYRDNTEEFRKAWAIANYLSDANFLHEVILNDAYNFFDKKYNQFLNFLINFYTKLRRDSNIVQFIIDFIEQVLIMVGYVLTFIKLINHEVSIGGATFYLRSLNIFTTSIEQVAGQFSDIEEFAIRMKDAKDLFDLQPEIKDGTIETGKYKEPPLIKFNNLTFHYPHSDKSVIDKLNLEIKPGEKIAIVGENGAGKTTLVKLLCRLYKVSEGEILIDSNNINDLKISSWYQNLGVLFQEYNNYGPFSAYENILLGDPNAHEDFDKVIAAAKAANAYEFIDSYKYKFDNILSEKFKEGIRPSTGQWQKIAIARFFYRNAPVVIFDEPTAAIDAVSEAKIFNEIYDFFKGKTVIIISHRFSTVRQADKIYVLDKGKIIESGSHEELLKLDGKYAQSFNSQAAGYR